MKALQLPRLSIAALLAVGINSNNIYAAENQSVEDSLRGINTARLNILLPNGESMEARQHELASTLEGHILNGYAQSSDGRTRMLSEMLTSLKAASVSSQSNYRYSRKIVDASLFLGDGD